MKNKKKIIILGILTSLVIAGIIIFLLLNKKEEPTKLSTNCQDFTGGSYTLIFNTNGGDNIENMSVCIACAPDSYPELPVAQQKGKTFIGWFYDEEFEKPVTVITTGEISAIEKKDTKGCKIGYENITLYAKWEDAITKTLKVNFDSNGGSKVNSIVVNCDNENNAILPTLPRSTRDGYSFVAWVDKNEMSILTGAKIVCNGDLNLKAKWNKNNDPAPETDKNVTYKCEEGWNLNGTNCSHEVKTSGQLTCASGETLIDKYCVNFRASDDVVKSNTIKTCKKETIRDDYGNTQEYDGVLGGDNVTCFYKVENEPQETCATRGFTWNGKDGKCYKKAIRSNTTSKCSDTSHYLYILNPNQYDGINGKNSGCYPYKNASGSCPAGYEDYTIRGLAVICTHTETKPATKVTN